ncbi:acyltransferase [Alteromonas sp. KC3]|jgi:1-acyl-sn-glycerol-3-phosphate acyltransferase|uniref:1-acyl-sn-glycerol-3-phosphate acyltransferase n=1 Tax=unclassified Alteromonas TaxID=2614992 RepID=UPI0019208748|nr:MULTISPECIES: 1-acyl-sn-glycerol-3-phosphate acyltransferase [unclassified Alteromonas]BCO18949.1 acyltransferase [Alteromonas sp. KC3]BCO22906.1 acyltransferase [Alteromonas sp. KC14]
MNTGSQTQSHRRPLSQVNIGKLVSRKWPRWLSRFATWLLTKRGWVVEGEFINERKAIIAVAPHTSNWDFFIGLFVVFSFRLNLNFFGKHTIFKPPLGAVVRRLGGIPIERSKAHGVVSVIATQIKQADDLILALAPEGTRSPIFPWKTGFMHIAREAEIPIQVIGIDYAKKAIVLGPIIQKVTNIDEQMQTIYAFYDTVCAKYPKNCITRS